MQYDVSVIGTGRVGLPLALCFAERGLSVLGVERDTDRLNSIAAGNMPFEEPGAQELLEQAQKSGRLGLSSRAIR